MALKRRWLPRVITERREGDRGFRFCRHGNARLRCSAEAPRKLWGRATQELGCLLGYAHPCLKR